jgi:hypothetical protein
MRRPVSRALAEPVPHNFALSKVRDEPVSIDDQLGSVDGLVTSL